MGEARKVHPFLCPFNRQVGRKIRLDDTEFTAAKPVTSYTAIHGGSFIKATRLFHQFPAISGYRYPSGFTKINVHI
jgi:hypothetical protein